MTRALLYIALPLLCGCEVATLSQQLANPHYLPVLNTPPTHIFQKTSAVLIDIGSGFEACHAKYPSITELGGELIMLYGARAGNCDSRSIGIATSTDGIAWTKHGQFRLASSDHPSTIFYGNVWHLYYSQVGADGRLRIFHASASSFDQLGTASASKVSFGGSGYQSFHPTVLEFDSRMHMYYNRMPDGYNMHIAHAESDDGITWVESSSYPPPSPLEGMNEIYTYNVFVRQNSQGLLQSWASAWVSGSLNGLRRQSCIVYAESADQGTTWRKDTVPTLCNESGADAYAAFAPYVRETSDGLFMYYSGADANHRYRILSAVEVL